MVPSEERLDADDSPIGGADHRLVVEPKFFQLCGMAQIPQERITRVTAALLVDVDDLMSPPPLRLAWYMAISALWRSSSGSLP